jgi:hypothetical protein
MWTVMKLLTVAVLALLVSESSFVRRPTIELPVSVPASFVPAVNIQEATLGDFLLQVAHLTYPTVALRYVLVGKPNHRNDGFFSGESPLSYLAVLNVGGFAAKTGTQRVLDVLSHEVGHYLEPRFQRSLYEEDVTRRRYGQRHEIILTEYEKRFSQAMQRPGSLANSTNYYMTVLRDSLEMKLISKSRFASEYKAEAMAVYFSGSITDGGALSAEEETLINEYVSYLAGAPFPRNSLKSYREQLVAMKYDVIQDIIKFYQPPP